VTFGVGPKGPLVGSVPQDPTAPMDYTSSFGSLSGLEPLSSAPMPGETASSYESKPTVKKPSYLAMPDWEAWNAAEANVNLQSAEADEEIDPVVRVAQYGNYVREQLLSAGAYDVNAEVDVRTGMAGLLYDKGVIDQEDTALAAKTGVYESKLPGFEDRFKLLKSAALSSDDGFDFLSQYDAERQVASRAGKNVTAGRDPEFISRYEALRTEAQKQTENPEFMNRARRRLLANGELKFAEITESQAEGPPRTFIEVAAGAEQGDVQKEILKAVKAGALSADRAYEALDLVAPTDLGRPKYQVARNAEVFNSVQQFLTDPAFGATERYATSLRELRDDIVNADIGKDPQLDAESLALGVALDMEKAGVLPEGQRYDTSEIKLALQKIGAQRAMGENKLKFYTEEGTLGNNIRTHEDGTVYAHPSLLVSPNFEQAITERGDSLTAAQRKSLELQRDYTLEAQFDDYNELLQRAPGAVSEKWAQLRNSRMAAGTPNSAILTEFLADETNFNAMAQRFGGVGMSVADGFGELLAIGPAWSGADWAAEYLADNAQRKSDRREVARLFGANFGLEQDLAEAVAPMIVDIAATVALAPVTQGASVAGFVAKQGAKLTAKGMVKSVVSRTLMSAAGETAEQTAMRNTLANVIKSSVSTDDAIGIIKDYSKLMGSKWPTLPAQGISAAARSGASSYGSLYNTLRSDPNNDMSAEEMHQTALRGSLATAAITGTIAMGFSGFGAGGIEDVVLAGASRKRVKDTLSRLAGVDDISNDAFKKIVKDRLGKAVRTMGLDGGVKFALPQTIRTGLEESVEEGVDQFVNSWVEESFTGDERMPMSERMTQTLHAMLVGGILGSGVAATASGFRKLRYGSAELEAYALRKAEDDFIESVTGDLNSTGSPTTANVMRTILSAGSRGRLRAPEGFGDAENTISRSEAVDILMAQPAEGDVDPDAEAAAVLAALDANVTPEAVYQNVLGDQLEFDFDDARLEPTEPTAVDPESGLWDPNLAPELRDAAEDLQMSFDFDNEATWVSAEAQQLFRAQLALLSAARAKLPQEVGPENPWVSAFPTGAPIAPTATEAPGTPATPAAPAKTAREEAYEQLEMFFFIPASGDTKVQIETAPGRMERRILRTSSEGAVLLPYGQSVDQSEIDQLEQDQLDAKTRRGFNPVVTFGGNAPSFADIAEAGFDSADVAIRMETANYRAGVQEFPAMWAAKAREIAAAPANRERITETEEFEANLPVSYTRDTRTAKKAKFRKVLLKGETTNIALEKVSKGWRVLVGGKPTAAGGFNGVFPSQQAFSDKIQRAPGNLVKAGARITRSVVRPPSAEKVRAMTNKALGLKTPDPVFIGGAPAPENMGPRVEVPKATAQPAAQTAPPKTTTATGEPPKITWSPNKTSVSVEYRLKGTENKISGGTGDLVRLTGERQADGGFIWTTNEKLVSGQWKRQGGNTPAKLASGKMRNQLNKEFGADAVAKLEAGAETLTAVSEAPKIEPITKVTIYGNKEDAAAKKDGVEYALKDLTKREFKRAASKAKQDLAQAEAESLKFPDELPRKQRIADLEFEIEQYTRLSTPEGFNAELARLNAELAAQATPTPAGTPAGTPEGAPSISQNGQTDTPNPDEDLSKDAQAPNNPDPNLVAAAKAKGKKIKPKRIKYPPVKAGEYVRIYNADTKEAVADGLFIAYGENADEVGNFPVYFMTQAGIDKVMPAGYWAHPLLPGEVLMGRRNPDSEIEAAERRRQLNAIQADTKRQREARIAEARRKQEMLKLVTDESDTGVWTEDTYNQYIAPVLEMGKMATYGDTVGVVAEAKAVSIPKQLLKGLKRGTPAALNAYRDRLQQWGLKQGVDAREAEDGDKAVRLNALSQRASDMVLELDKLLRAHNSLLPTAERTQRSMFTGLDRRERGFSYYADPLLFPVNELGGEMFRRAEYLIHAGYPVRLSNNKAYGFPVMPKARKGYYEQVSNMIKAAIQVRYPTLPAPEVAGVRRIKSGAVTVDGAAFFDNDPEHAVILLERGHPDILIPDDFPNALINKAFKIREDRGRRYVVGVYSPAKIKGEARESMVQEDNGVKMARVELNYGRTNAYMKFNSLFRSYDSASQILRRAPKTEAAKTKLDPSQAYDMKLKPSDSDEDRVVIAAESMLRQLGDLDNLWKQFSDWTKLQSRRGKTFLQSGKVPDLVQLLTPKGSTRGLFSDEYGMALIDDAAASFRIEYETELRLHQLRQVLAPYIRRKSNSSDEWILTQTTKSKAISAALDFFVPDPDNITDAEARALAVDLAQTFDLNLEGLFTREEVVRNPDTGEVVIDIQTGKPETVTVVTNEVNPAAGVEGENLRRVMTGFITKMILPRKPNSYLTYQRMGSRIANRLIDQVVARGAYDVVRNSTSFDELTRRELARSAEQRGVDQSRFNEGEEGDVSTAEVVDNILGQPDVAPLLTPKTDSEEIIDDMPESLANKLRPGVFRSLGAKWLSKTMEYLIEADPVLRDALFELHASAVRMGLETYGQEVSPDDTDVGEVFSELAMWLGSASHNQNPEVLRFRQMLTDPRYDVPGAGPLRGMLTALTDLDFMFISPDPNAPQPAGLRAPLDPMLEGAVNTLLNQMAAPTTREIAAAQFPNAGFGPTRDVARAVAKGTEFLWEAEPAGTFTEQEKIYVMQALAAQVRRVLLANSYITSNQQAAAAKANLAEADKLGLKSGDVDSVFTAFSRIENDMSYPLSLRLAARILQGSRGLTGDTQFVMRSEDSQAAGRHITSENGQTTVVLNIRGSNGESLASVLVHEYMHDFLTVAINSDPASLTPQQAAALKTIQTLFAQTKAALKSAPPALADDPRLTDGLANLDEFVAHFFASTAFQAKVRELGGTASARGAKGVGFFQRIMDAIMDFFGFPQASREQDIFRALIDLSFAVRAPALPNISSVMAEASVNAATEAKIAIARRVALEKMRRKPVIEQELTGATSAAVPSNLSPVKQNGGLVPNELKPRRAVRDQIDRALYTRIAGMKIIPPEIPVVLSRAEDTAAWADSTGTLYINPERMGLALQTIPEEGQKEVLQKIIEHELDHIASIHTISKKEMTKFVATLSDADFLETARRYYGHSNYKLPDDPALREQHKFMLAEERIRMRKEEVLTGQTTEETIAFWRTKPDSLTVLKHYFQQSVARYDARRKLRNLTPEEGLLVTRLVNEVRRIKMGYRRPLPGSLFSTDDLERQAAFADLQLSLTEPTDQEGSAGANPEPIRVPVVREGMYKMIFVDPAAARAAVAGLSDELTLYADLPEVQALFRTLDEFAQSPIEKQADMVQALRQVEAMSQGLRQVEDALNAEVGEGAERTPRAPLFGIRVKAAADALEATLLRESDYQGEGVVAAQYRLGQAEAWDRWFASAANAAEAAEAEAEAEAPAAAEAPAPPIAAGPDPAEAPAPRPQMQDMRLRDRLKADLSEQAYNKWTDLELAQLDAYEGGDSEALGSLTKPKRNAALRLFNYDPEVEAEYATEIDAVRAARAAVAAEVAAKRAQGEGPLPSLTASSYDMMDWGSWTQSNPAPTPATVAAETAAVAKAAEVAVAAEAAPATAAKSASKRSGKRATKTSVPVADVEETAYNATDDYRDMTVMATQFGSDSDLPANIVAGTRDYSPLFDLLRLPLMEVGTYKSPSNFFVKLARGEFDSRWRRLTDQKASFEKMSTTLLKEFKTTMDNIIRQDFTSPEEIASYAAAASGTTEPTFTKEAWAKLEDRYLEELSAIQVTDPEIQQVMAAIMAADPSVRSMDAKAAAYQQLREAKVELVAARRDTRERRLRTYLSRQAKVRRDEALNYVNDRSPRLATKIAELRMITDELSAQARNIFGTTRPGIEITMDSQMGLYVTRAYRIFDDADFRQAVTAAKGDPKRTQEIEDILSVADAEFEGQYLTMRTEAYITKEGRPRDEAERMAKEDLDRKNASGLSVGEQARIEFLRQYEGGGAVPRMVTDPEFLQLVDRNLKRRQSLSEPIRKLLGEYGQEQGANLLLHTYATVSGIASHAMLLDQIKTQGRMGDADSEQWLFSPEDIEALGGGGIDGLAKGQAILHERGFAPIQIARGQRSIYNPLAGHYGPRDLVDAIARVGAAEELDAAVDASRTTTKFLANAASKATGASMGLKTLGSVGHFFRNVISQPFMAWSQGRPIGLLPGMTSALAGELKGLTFRSWRGLSDEVIDNQRLEYINLGIIGDEVRPGVLRDLIRGKRTTDDIQSEAIDLFAKLPEGMAKGMALFDKATEFIGRVEAATEAFYKIAYYEDTLATLRAAKKDGRGSIRGVQISMMSDYDLKREAAEQVRSTAPSHGRTLPVVKQITKSGPGLLLAPFLRWKSEMVRTSVNTLVLARAEMKSGNPVLVMRGAKRLIGMSSMVIMSGVMPVMLSKLLGGIGDEEDEALRESMPEYLRNHSFFYFMKDGKLSSLDLTYVNPFSQLVDPWVRAIADLVSPSGGPAKAASRLVQAGIVETFLDDQILFGTVMSAKRNMDPTTGDPIWIEGVDDPGAAALKTLKFIMDDAFAPRLIADSIKAWQATGKDASLTRVTPGSILLSGIYPVRTHPVDPEQQLRRYLYNAQQKYDLVSKNKFKALADAPMSAEDMRELYAYEARVKQRINSDVYRKIQGFAGMGVPMPYIANQMNEMRFGKERTRLLFMQTMAQPELSEKYMSALMAKPYGPARIDAMIGEKRKTPKLMSLDEVR